MLIEVVKRVWEVAKKKKQAPKPKHIPYRTCVGCREKQPKGRLIRIVRTPEGPVVVDEAGKARGRGAYLCRKPACWEAALKRGSLNRALRTSLQPEEIETLRAYADGLRVDPEAAPEAKTRD
jgi:hypothetical protein